ncbi:hypothetical protein Ahy_A08g040920 isoform E [Arachis hypogaea]|uniref:Uncharacterized protein n=2 Tax=Arachis hypogaea TaxID=3818 RepID=A0A445C124_ARAHY|nr:hypothetical protein Ahy_A08g040920 isoform E [Arachis hypogaea]
MPIAHQKKQLHHLRRRQLQLHLHHPKKNALKIP